MIELGTMASTALCLVVVCLGGCREPAHTAPELAIVASEYGFHMPDSIPAGLVHITLRNAGKDMHEAQLVHFTDTIGTAAAYVDSIRAHVDFPSNAEDIGGAALTLPADSSGVWLRLTPGRYAVVCWKEDHLSRGMAHDLRVVESHGDATDAPVASHQLTLVNFAFILDTPFVRGRSILHVRNTGTEPHEGDIIKLSSTAGFREYLAWLEGDEHGLPPTTPVGGFGDLYPGKEAWTDLHLTPGRYLILCGVRAKADHNPHYTHGMFKEFTIR